jgi:hypothetical protein
MQAEVSALVHLRWSYERPVENVHIGSGVLIKRLESEWLDAVKSQCPKVKAREEIEFLAPYTHRFFYQLEAEEKQSGHLNLATHQEKQPLLRAIILSRLVKPTSIAYDSVWVKSFYPVNGTARHYHNQVINNLNVAFLSGGVENWNTITEPDAAVMAELWDSLQFFLDDANEPKYRRIVRTIKYNEYAYAIYFAEVSHPIIHAALESMICTGKRENKAQIIQRLPQLVSFINQQQAGDIYDTCCGFKHEAQAMLQHLPGSTGELAPTDQRRVDSVTLLRRAIRELLTRALRERSFADILADPKILRQCYPAYQNGKLI